MDKKIDFAKNAENGFFDTSGVKNVVLETVPERSLIDTRHAADDGKDSGDSSAKSITAESNSLGKTKPEGGEPADVTGKITVSSSGVSDSDSRDGDRSETEKEDAEFLDLIKGKYRDAYRRRTEKIIRKRLKIAKVKSPENIGDSSENAALSVTDRGLSGGKGSSTRTDGEETLVENVTDPLEKEALSKNATDPSEKEEVTSSITDRNEKNVLSKNAIAPTENEARLKNSIVLQKSANKNRPRENGVGGSVGIFTGISVSALKGDEVLELLRRAENGEIIKFKD